MEFKNNIIDHLEKKGLSKSSISLYVKNLERLNNGMQLRNFKFLNDVESILNQLENYKDTTNGINIYYFLFSINFY